MHQNKSRKANDLARIYCGAYQIKVGAVEQLGRLEKLPEVATACVVHEIENREIAHATIRIELHPSMDSEAIEEVKTALIVSLWSQSIGPAAHVCAVDAGEIPHPSGSLAIAPMGSYRDDRSRLRIALDYLIFKIWFEPQARRQLRPDQEIATQ
jgi:hypothetical protein